ncbi:hypothetical protein [Mucilaginibacter pocheonensis]|uniref:Uncharacterized protein n=1 Tax=Mucilaginibacter pocheonensis TaxID=398050 RepID=A0ABU1TGI9_9SPHI|nr:hypothetical protein [Mucilaginibacter pocheonensis]MDR6944477.1 hypothetical protein [Mucilaginibacter pocheonensis]
MKRSILLVLLVVSTGVLSSSSSSSSKKNTAELQQVSFNKIASAFKRDLGSAD